MSTPPQRHGLSIPQTLVYRAKGRGLGTQACRDIRRRRGWLFSPDGPADEAGTLKRLKSLNNELMQPEIEARKGRIVKLMGDGLLAEFPSVVEAVMCAVTIQQSILGRETALTQERPIRLRIGVNLGDIIVEGADIYGDGVNVAARLEALADPGGICISGSVFDQVKGKVDLDFADLGERQVKNIAQRLRVYRINLGGDAAEGEAHSAATVGNIELAFRQKPAIAVLPFENMSGDPEQEYFSDGFSRGYHHRPLPLALLPGRRPQLHLFV